MSAQLQPIETVGGLIDELFLLREQRRKLAETDKDLRDQYAELEVRLIASITRRIMDSFASLISTEFSSSR